MKITILGWYGTETIGDRAILAGILKILSEALPVDKVFLGSLYPFFSERTLREDRPFWKKFLKIDINIELFDSKSYKTLDEKIKNSDLVIIGGGPLMHILPMYMLLYAFKKAKKLNKKTAIIGCGAGPLFHKNYQECLAEIVEHSDLTIFRDKASLETYKSILKDLNKNVPKDIYTSLDPSIVACLYFKKYSKKDQGNYIAVNLRKFPKIYSNSNDAAKINNNLSSFIDLLHKRYPTDLIKLIPMHTFHLGGDDRDFFNKLLENVGKKNIFVQNKPQSLEMTMRDFYKAKVCYGMRYHSVILQTFLNGNNFILDYSEPKVGKIAGFISEIDTKNFYRERYISLYDTNDFSKFNSKLRGKYSYSKLFVHKKMELYKANLSKMFS